MTKKPVFTTFEAAKICHVSPLSIINWVNAGRLSAFRTPGGHRRIRREDLILFMRDTGLPIPEDLQPDSGRKKVLIVDDERAICRLLSDHLTSLPDKPYDVSTASDGFEAGKMVGTLRPDVVVLDLRMAGMDGFQVCKTIKADPETAGTLVIAITGYHTPETESRILECGAIRCFAKPVDMGTLSSFIAAELERQRSSRSGRGRSARA